MAIKMTAEDRKWLARSDADVLAKAIEILGDSKRLAAAKKAAQEQVKATQLKYSFATGGRIKKK